MLRKVFERSWRRLFAVNAVACALAWIIAKWAAETSNVSIVANHWAEVVYFQTFLQLATAALGDFASGKASDERGAALATLGLAAGAFSALAARAFVLMRSDPPAVDTVAQDTLLGAIYCASDPGSCSSLYTNATTIAFAWLLVICCLAAWLLRGQLNQSASKKTPILSAGTLCIAAAVGHSFVFLVVNRWEGVVSWQPLQLPTIDPLGTDLSAEQRNFLSFQIAATAAIAGTVVLQAAGFWLAVGLRKHTLRVLTEISRSFVASAIQLAIFLGLLLLDLVVVLLLATIVGSIAIAAVWGLWTSFAAIGLAAGIVVGAAVEASIAVWAWLSGIFDAAYRAMPGILATLFKIVLVALAVTASIFTIWLVAIILNQGFKGLSTALGMAFTFLVDAGTGLASHIPEILQRRPAAIILSLAMAASLTVAVFLRTARADDGTSTSPGPVIDPPIVSDSQPIAAHKFSLSEIDCSSRARGRELYWAFDSSDSIAVDTALCRLNVDREPATVLVLGTVSQDSTSAGGFALSVRRGEKMAAIVRSQYPSATIVIAAMGRELPDGPTLFGNSKIYSYGRPLVAFTSAVVIPQPIRRVPLSETTTKLLEEHGLLDRFETCALFIYQVSLPPKRIPERREDGNFCSWR